MKPLFIQFYHFQTPILSISAYIISTNLFYKNKNISGIKYSYPQNTREQSDTSAAGNVATKLH